MLQKKDIKKKKPVKGPTISKSRRLCEAVTCLKRCTFANEYNKARFCKEHKSPGMIDVRSRRCNEAKCNKHPAFAMEGEKPQFCVKHKSQGMIDVVNQRCEEPLCNKQPTFAMEGDKAQFCAQHKSQGMIDVRNPRCNESSCNKHATFAVEGNKAQFCVKHKSHGMIDVANQRCEEPLCNKQPTSAMEGDKAQFCAQHRLPGMIDVVSHRCESDACAFYGFGERTFAQYRIDDKSLCSNCFSHLYPERTRVKVRKEQFILAEIERRIPQLCEYKATWDCALGNCVISKPDMYWFIQQIGIHLEIDEHGIDHEDDDHRVAEIHTASGMDGTLLIRFNPDEYVDEAGNEVSSCFRRFRLCTGDPRLEGTPEFGRRMDVLEEVMHQKLRQAEAGEVPTQENWKTQLFF